ncbi:MAG: glutamate synthase-related protein [Leptospirales bacterium]|jgi:glutamate synthase domain-containing protein 2
MKNKTAIARYSELETLKPSAALVANVDLVIIAYKDEGGRPAVSVLYGRCLHRGAMLADGHVDGEDLICGVHGWDFRFRTGVSAYANDEVLPKFAALIEGDQVFVDEDEIRAWERKNPQPYNREEYLGQYADIHGGPDEYNQKEIARLAKDGLTKTGHHGPVSAMGVTRLDLPRWESLQFQTAQLHRLPLMDDDAVGTDLVIGPAARRPLELSIPLFVSDMSFGALSEEAKVALATGAELAGTGVCSGEGGMLPEEQAANSRYLYELASAKFGFHMEKLTAVQAFHFKAGQGAKTGTGGHLPGNKVKGRIAEVRELNEGESAISPPRFKDLANASDFRKFGEDVRETTGGIPIGFKISANHIEKNIDFALDAGADYIILDGRGGGTGAAPLIFRDNISIPTIPALARARRHLDKMGRKDITLIITGGLRTAADFAKALCLGADGIALSNSALQAIGCLGMRACHTNNCPVGIATQQTHLRERLIVQKSAERLKNFFHASVELMQVMARACGHNHLNQFSIDDLTTLDREMAYLTGVEYAGVVPL